MLLQLRLDLSELVQTVFQFSLLSLDLILSNPLLLAGPNNGESYKSTLTNILAQRFVQHF